MKLELRPLSAGEVLDRTFQFFRARLGMFVGIATVGAAVRTAGATLQTFSLRYLNSHGYGHAVATVWSVSSILVNIAISLLAYSLVFAAITAAVMALHLGRPTGISEAYREVGSRWFRFVRISFAVGLLCLWPLLIVSGLLGAAIALAPRMSAQTAPVIAGALGFAALAMVVALPLCVWMICRYALSWAACVVEDLKVWQSLKRSVSLSKGLRWRIFLLLLVVYVIEMILSASLIAPTFIFLMRAHGQLSLGIIAYQLALGFVVTALISPIYGIGLTVNYLDARIRKEGYDIELMMQQSTDASGLSADPSAPLAV
jgi:hypothetical protein